MSDYEPKRIYQLPTDTIKPEDFVAIDNETSGSRKVNFSDVLGTKQDTETGKGLSTNDYTNEEKQKLSNLPSDAQKNVQADWNESDSTKDSFINNKPTIPPAVTVDTELSNASTNPVQNKVINAKTIDIEHDLTIGDLAFSKVSIPVVRPSDWLELGISTTTGRLINSELVRVTRFFPIDDTCDYRFTGIVRKEGESENRVYFNYFYDKDKKFIGRSTSTIVENAKFVRFGYGFSSASGIKVDDYGFENLIADWSAEFTPSYVKKENETTEKLQVLDDNKADVIISTASGSIAHFEDGANADAVSVIAHIEPVQDLHGYDHPWVGGSGKNICPPLVWKGNIDTISGEYSVGTSSALAATAEFIPVDFINNTTYILSYDTSALPENCKNMIFAYNADKEYLGRTSGAVVVPRTFTKDSFVFSQTLATGDPAYVRIRMYDVTYTESGIANGKFQVEIGDTATAYEPYSNICPITGRTGLNILTSDEDTTNPTTYPISWQTEAGTVYGGYVDAVRGELVVDRAIVDLGTLNWDAYTDSDTGIQTFRNTSLRRKYSLNEVGISDTYAFYGNATLNGLRTLMSDKQFGFQFSNTGTLVRDDSYADAEAFTAGVEGVMLVYPLATPITYTLTPTEITILLGTNNIWNDANGETEVEYRADTKLYIEQLTKPTEDDMVANTAIQNGKFFMVGNRLFLSTSAIASGDTINPGTNCTELSLADALNNLN